MRNHLNNNELDVVQKVVQHNAHMAHPENILLCEIMYEDQDYRKIALEKYFYHVETRKLISHFREKFPSSFD